MSHERFYVVLRNKNQVNILKIIKYKFLIERIFYFNLRKVNGKAIAIWGYVLLQQSRLIHKYIYMLKIYRKMSHLHVYAQYFDILRLLCLIQGNLNIHSGMYFKKFFQKVKWYHICYKKI